MMTTPNFKTTNRLLRSLHKTALSRLQPHLRMVKLELDDILVREGEKIELVYFPNSGIISGLVDLERDPAVEASTVGKDGVFGAGQALDHRVSLNDAVVTVAGMALVIPATHLDRLAADDPGFRKDLMSYEQFSLALVQQNAVCNAAHSVKQRYAKMLLRRRDLASDAFFLPQQIAARYLAVRRTTVTQAAIELAGAGAIKFHRGQLEVVKANILEAAACECHNRIKGFYERLVVKVR